MAYQMTITLTDQEYAALVAEATRSGKPIEALVHDAIAPHLPSPGTPQAAMTSRAFIEQQHREGKILAIPTRRPLTPQEQTERERLAQKLATGKPLSEIVIEDRGPRE